MSRLPQELITDILLRLPVKLLVRFQCVSKSWHALINDPNFIKMHLKISIAANREQTIIFLENKIEPPQDCLLVRFNDDNQFDRAVKIRQPLSGLEGHTQILPYCNGLVCIHTNRTEVAIWNPLIRRYKKLPIEHIEKPFGFDSEGYPFFAFGHDPINDDYKVMRIVKFFRNIKGAIQRAYELKIYSLRVHSWKRVEKEWPYKLITSSSTASLNGAFHWLVTPLGGSMEETLLAFDLATEKFRSCRIPFQQVHGVSMLVLEVLKGCICVCVNVFDTLVDVWVMKEYGAASSWTRLYTIERSAVPWPFEYCKPSVYSKDGKKVLMEQYDEFLFWYDIEEKRGRRVQFRGMPSSFSFEMAICVGSLVLLDGDIVNNNQAE